ncbi:HAD-superfamily hydrolase, subfamily IIB [Deinococcus peraridilitoris DSM 19664]|uniref:HAD-superfamily hydrolase, subfamily IIB n=2 Tax=Deinococcus TaxID=1298 RepID=L0A6A1_DEIPD|nr:HAD-superfamily hydrolase, subfamily IIB [Deinococcus peraridilitoris DSM 19664]
MRLIAFDLDGTLLDHDKSIPQRSSRVIEQLRAHGCLFAVITGRARVPDDVMSTVRPQATATSNGGSIAVGEEMLIEHLLTPEQIRAVDALVPQDAEVIAFGTDAVYARDPHTQVFDWLSGRTLKPLEEAARGRVLKFNVRHPEAWRYRETIEALGDMTVTGGVAPYEHFLTVTPARANKGDALRDIARALDVPLAQTVAFGDSDNDLAMFQVAGTAVQVGQAECLVGRGHHQVSCAALGLPGWLEYYLGELARELPRA